SIGEDASSYALALRELAQTCNFGEQLDAHLRDRFIVGLRDDATKKQIIRVNPDTFDLALSAAQTSELTNQSASTSSQSHSIHKIDKFRANRNSQFKKKNRQHQNKFNSQSCNRCGRYCHKGECP
ncbi:unnamed protein product, partial [Sphagnum compactum]